MNAPKSFPRWLIWVFAFWPLAGFWTTGLTDLDEGFYGAVTFEMIRYGHWITPHYNGAPWFEKPILIYWISAPFLAIFGPEFGPRVGVVLCTMALYWAVHRWVKARWSLAHADAAVLMLAGSLLMAAVGRMMMTDAPLVLALTLCFLNFWDSLEGKKNARAWAGFWLGVSVLAKGPVGCILFVLIAVVTRIQDREKRLQWSGGWLVAVGLFFVAVCTWYVPAYLQSGQMFVQKFLIEQNIGRFTGGDEAHTYRGFRGYVMYVVVFILASLPWFFGLMKAWPRARVAVDAQFPARRYLATWSLVVFIFFTISSAKLIHYILPMMPAIMILLGVWWVESGKKLTPILTWVGIAGCIVTGGLIAYDLGIEADGKLIGPPYAELRQVAYWAKSKQIPVAVFQMPRREKALGTGQAKVQETSHPSLELYLEQPFIGTELVADFPWGNPFVVITRQGRITPEIRSEWELQGYSVRERFNEPTRVYEAFVLAPRP